jgi:hypothetical protein
MNPAMFAAMGGAAEDAGKLPMEVIQGANATTFGLAQGIGTSFANNEMQRRNREMLDELLGREARGQLGMTPEQQRVMGQALSTPIAQRAQEDQQRSEAIAAAAGGSVSGADLSRLRTESSRATDRARQDAAMQVALAQQAAIQQQRNEIEQRMGLKAALRRDDIEGILTPLAQGMSAAGQAAGSPPASFNLRQPTTLPAEGAAAPAPSAAASSIPGETLPATGGPAASADTSGLARTSAPQPSGPTFTEEETAQLEGLAENNPQLFAQLFIARLRARGGSARSASATG